MKTDSASVKNEKVCIAFDGSKSKMLISRIAQCVIVTKVEGCSGISVGDTLVSVDDRNVDEIPVEEIQEFLEKSIVQLVLGRTSMINVTEDRIEERSSFSGKIMNYVRHRSLRFPKRGGEKREDMPQPGDEQYVATICKKIESKLKLQTEECSYSMEWTYGPSVFERNEEEEYIVMNAIEEQPRVRVGDKIVAIDNELVQDIPNVMEMLEHAVELQLQHESFVGRAASDTDSMEDMVVTSSDEEFEEQQVDQKIENQQTEQEVQQVLLKVQNSTPLLQSEEASRIKRRHAPSRQKYVEMPRISERSSEKNQVEKYDLSMESKTRASKPRRTHSGSTYLVKWKQDQCSIGLKVQQVKLAKGSFPMVQAVCRESCCDSLRHVLVGDLLVDINSKATDTISVSKVIDFLENCHKPSLLTFKHGPLFCKKRISAAA